MERETAREAIHDTLTVAVLVLEHVYGSRGDVLSLISVSRAWHVLREETTLWALRLRAPLMSWRERSAHYVVARGVVAASIDEAIRICRRA